MTSITVQDVHTTWVSGAGNVPQAYIDGTERSNFLADIVDDVASTDDAILEIGSNVGRNLDRLISRGYTNLSGLEINESAVKLGEAHFAQPSAMHIGAIEDLVKDLPSFDVIYTMAVLEHIHPSSEWVFAEIAARCKMLITIEDEGASSDWKWPRDYKAVFEGLGMAQTELHNCARVNGLTKNFEARVFTHA